MGKGSNYVGIIFLVNLTKKLGNIWELSNYVGMIFLDSKQQKCDKNKGGGSKYVGMIFKAKQTTKM